MTAASVHVLTVDADGDALAEQLADAGLTVSGPASVAVGGLDEAIRAAPGADAVCIVGSFGLRSALADALQSVLEHPLPGYGEAWRAGLEGAAKLSDRVSAGLVAGRLVFAVPAAADASARAGALVAEVLGGLESAESESPEPIPFGGGRASMGLSLSENREPEPSTKAAASDDEAEAGPEPGWKSAVHALGAEVLVGRREELPENIEKLAPVLNVLHTAGESGMMKLPSGRRYSLWGWPDLRRPNSKVLAVSWGEPLAEVVALHRHPGQAGTCIEEDNGLLPSSSASVADEASRICGRPPPSPDGTLFALSSDAVWILRGRRVFKWDGSREKDDGNPKQVLSSLTLHWSNR